MIHGWDQICFSQLETTKIFKKGEQTLRDVLALRGEQKVPILNLLVNSLTLLLTKKCWVCKNVGSKKMLGTKMIFRSEKCVGSKQNFGSEKKF